MYVTGPQMLLFFVWNARMTVLVHMFIGFTKSH